MENNLAKISGTEIAIACKILVKQHQLTTITPPLLQSLKHLNIKQDQNGLLRCYGRLGRSELSAESENPMIVLHNSWLSQAIIQDCHEKGHPGIGHTMSIVREQVWIPKLRAQVTRIIRRCMLCQRFNNLPYRYPEQSDLPERRVLRSRPFAHVGLDYYGPLSISQPDGTDSKCYGSIITCMATRLIHLDVVSDLTTAAFLMMLRRFFGRRGLPNSITSDNAPTFALGEKNSQGMLASYSERSDSTKGGKQQRNRMEAHHSICSMARRVLRKIDKISEAFLIQDSRNCKTDLRAIVDSASRDRVTS
ncbi:hypothetical protein Aduo_009801 [Ancylostoma duodenale]